MRRAAYRRYRDGTVRDYLFSVPNALPYGGRQAMLQMVQLKREGLTPGCPDVECVIAIPPFTGMHIEMKRLDGVASDVTEAQAMMMARFKKCGRHCVVAFGAERAWRELTSYLQIPE